MSIGDRIRFFRMFRGLSTQHLGALLGMTDRYADVRVTQYETGFRTPREDMLKNISEILEVSPRAIALNVEDEIGIMQILFFLEDKYHFTPVQEDNTVILRIPMNDLMQEWNTQYQLYLDGLISRAQYDNWRYQLDTSAIPPDPEKKEE